MARKTQAELLEEEERIVAEQAKLVDEVLDQHYTLGGDPAEEEEREFLADKAEERRAETLDSPVTRRELERILSELRQTQELTHKVAKAQGSFEEVLSDQREYDERQARYQLYRAIKEHGGMVLIQIHTSDEAGGTAPVDVNLAGRKWELPRGVPISVPVEVMAILDEAKVDHWRPELLPDGSAVQTRHKFLRFPYVRLDGPNVLGG